MCDNNKVRVNTHTRLVRQTWTVQKRRVFDSWREKFQKFQIQTQNPFGKLSKTDLGVGERKRLLFYR